MAKPSYSTVSQKLGVCLNTLKYILAVTCFILFIIGLVIFSIGIATEVDTDVIGKLKLPNITSFPIWMIVIGLLLAIVSIFGAIGGCGNKRTLLIIFVICVAVILVAEFIVGIVAVAFKNQTIKLADKSWDTATNETREYFEKEFKCCGFYNYTDRPYLPACVFTVASSAIYDSSSSEIGTESKGCIDQIYDFINEYIVQIIVAIFVTFAIELVVLIFASILAYRIKVIHRNYSSMTDSQEDLFS